MKGCIETQAVLCGEGAFPCISGRIRISPLGQGSIVQVHIRGLPCRDGFFGLCIELCGRRYPLPGLPACAGEALMSVYAGAFCPEETIGGCILLTTDPCAPCGSQCIASGRIGICLSPCCPPDPRPLFAPQVYRSPGESTFY